MLHTRQRKKNDIPRNSKSSTSLEVIYFLILEGKNSVSKIEVAHGFEDSLYQLKILVKLFKYILHWTSAYGTQSLAFHILLS